MKGFRYEQSTGAFSIVNDDYVLPLAILPSGNGAAENDPVWQCAKNKGPLPRAVYSLALEPHPRFVHPAFRLVPKPGSDLCGRSGFWIHGGKHSEGCILAQSEVREVIRALYWFGFCSLSVVA